MTVRGPYYGVVGMFESDAPFENILKVTKEVYQEVIRSLPGFRAAMYYHIADKNLYCATYAFETESHADAALEVLRPEWEEIPGASLIKADVLSGTQIES